MSGQDRLTQMRGLLLIRSDGEFTCKRSKKIGAVFSLSCLFYLQEHQGLMKRPQIGLPQRYWHFFFHLFGKELHHVAWAAKTGFLSATGEGWVLLCTEKDEDFSYSRTIQFMIYKILSVRNRKYTMLSMPRPYAMNSRLQLAYSVAISAVVCHLLASLPHRSAFWFQELNYSATFVDVVLQVNAAELCSSWNCSSSLIAEGRSPTPTSSAARCEAPSSFTYAARVCGQNKWGKTISYHELP